MKHIRESAMVLARASNGNPVTSTAVVILFWFMFSIIEAGIERMIFGERFEHWFDVIFAGVFMAYAAYAVIACAVFNSTKEVK